MEAVLFPAPWMPMKRTASLPAAYGMEAVLFIGIQGAGKSTFYLRRFADTHVRINKDMLKTRYREQVFLHASILAKQPFVGDNTNVLASERAKYIEPAKAAGFRIVGYYFPV